MLRKATDARTREFAWGRMEWLFSGEPDAPLALSTGKMLIRAGHENDFYRHSNCEEVLHLVSGQLLQKVGDAEYRMESGDTAFIPVGAAHRSRALGSSDAVVLVSYSAARREYEALQDTSAGREG